MQDRGPLGNVRDLHAAYARLRVEADVELQAVVKLGGEAPGRVAWLLGRVQGYKWAEALAKRLEGDAVPRAKLSRGLWAQAAHLEDAQHAAVGAGPNTQQYLRGQTAAVRHAASLTGTPPKPEARVERVEPA